MKRLAVSAAIASILALSSQNAMAHRISHDDFMKKKSDFKTMLKEAGKDWVDKKKEEARERKEVALEEKEQRKEEARHKKDEWIAAWGKKKQELDGDLDGLDDIDDTGNTGNLGSVDSEPLATPVPAAVWLFSSGLLGLAAVSRRKNDKPVSG